MEEQIKEFTSRLISHGLTDQNIIDEKLRKFSTLEDHRMVVLANHEFFAGSNCLTSYLKVAIQEDPRQSQPIRKQLYEFITNYIQSHYLTLIDHVKFIFSELLLLFWREEGRNKQRAIQPVILIVETYDESFLANNQILKPQKLHQDIKTMLQTQKKSHGVIGQCWYLLAVIQRKFPLMINPNKKKMVQEMIFIELKQYVNTDKNLNTIAALLRALAKALRQNYFGEALIEDLFRYVIVLIPPLKATYAVHLAALELLSQRRQLFHFNIMLEAKKLFSILREGTNHKNKDYSMKCLQVLIEVTEQIVKGILAERERYRSIFIHIEKQILQDLQSYIKFTKNEGEIDRKGLNMLTVVRLLAIIAPLYQQFEGKAQYKKLFDYIIQRCTKKILKQTNAAMSSTNNYEIKFVLYHQKQLKSLVYSLACMVQYLQEIDYEAAAQLQSIFLSAVRQSKFFLPKYEPQLWQAMIRLIMSIHAKGVIFGKWAKMIVSQSLRECLDSKKMQVQNDQQFIKMISKSAHLWRSILTHSDWRAGALHQFTQYLLANFQYLILNLNCGYRVKNEDDEEKQSSQSQSQEQGIVHIFYLANERIEITKIEDYQYLSSLSLLFHQILLCIDSSLYNQKLVNFYPQLLERIRAYPKCLPLLRTLRSLNQYILKNNFFKEYLSAQSQYSKQLIGKMSKFFNHTFAIVFKFQEQYFYELLKVLLSFSEEVYLYNNHRIIKHNLPLLLIKTFEIGQQVISLASAALRCMERLFKSQRQISEMYLLPVISSLQKYINLTTGSDRQLYKSQLFLFQLTMTREDLSNSVLSFLGSLGGLCHQLVDNQNKDHISWDYDCNFKVSTYFLRQKIKLNLARLLNRICWLCLNGKDDVKIVACQLLHAKITYMIEELVTNSMPKEDAAAFLDRTLPAILSVASNTSHPSQQLIHTLLIQMIHFFANTKQPSSPDVQIILKHLLSLYNKSEDMAFIASKCLSSFVRWHIKQQREKNGNVPILKALMSNIWSLVGNKNAREGIINFLIKLLKIIYRESEIMRYYLIQLGSLLVSLARYHQKLEPQFRYLIQKYTACVGKYLKYLIIPQEGRRYKKIPTIHGFMDQLYRTGFFSIYEQQREAAFMIWSGVFKLHDGQLGYNEVKFLKDRAHKQKKYLFGGSHALDFQQVQEGEFEKQSWKLIGLGEVWIKMLEERIFVENNLIQFLDLECIYLVSFVSLLAYFENPEKSVMLDWTQDLQRSIIFNFSTFLRLIKSFTAINGNLILGKFYFNLDQNNISENAFNSYLFAIVFQPQRFIGNCRDLLNENELIVYLQNLIHYLQVRQEDYDNRTSAIDKVFKILESQINLDVNKIVDYFSTEETASERITLCIMNFIKIAYRYERQHQINPRQNNKLKLLISKLLTQFQSSKPERHYNIITFILTFSYSLTFTFVKFEMQKVTNIFQKYQKHFINFIVNNWNFIHNEVIQICLASNNNIKLLYVLMQRLTCEQKQYFLKPVALRPISGDIIRDLLRLNFLLVSELNLNKNSQQGKRDRQKYLYYLRQLIDQGLILQNPQSIHEETLYLSALVLKNKLKFAAQLMQNLKGLMSSLGNKYCPFTVTKLEIGEKQESAMKYFLIIRNFIVLSEQFAFISQYFVILKDFALSESRKDIINNYIQDCVRTCFQLQNERPLEWAEYLLSLYWDYELDKDQWSNYRVLILEKIFRKAVTYIKLEYLQILFDKYIQDLDKILKKPFSTDSLKSLMLDMQTKSGAFLLVQLLYANLPRRQKKEGLRPVNDIHKLFIKYAREMKKNLDEAPMRLIRDHDQKQGQPRKAIKIYKQYNCYAYNCMVVLFISTQSNPQHFRSYLFQNNQQALWSNLVDVNQEEFGFEIETSFKVIQPYAPLRNKIKQIKAKIEKAYFQSSLYVVQQQKIPLGKIQAIQEQSDEDQQKQQVPIKNAHNIILNTVIEEDVVNKHPCMMNLLRLVDFLHTTYQQQDPGWMKPIDAYLSSPSIKLAETILLLKLILNRPSIFYQADVWAKHLLNYLVLQKTGSKYIHYFYRDTLKRYLSFLPQLVQVRPDPAKINFVIMKIVKGLPHQNIRVFSDNIDMLEELLRIPGAYVQKKVINSMLSSDKSEKDKNSWRMCAVITLKLCIAARVPILAESDYVRLRDTSARYDYYLKQVKNHLKYVYQLASESSKQYRIAVAGFLGQLLSFIFTSELEQNLKKQYFKSVSIFLISLIEKVSNRSTRQKFSIIIQKISIRFPQLLADQKLFSVFEDSLFQFTGNQRYSLLLAFKQFSKSLITYRDFSKITNFFMLLRVNCEKLVADSDEVRLTLLQILNMCADSQLLVEKNIIYSYYLIVDKLDSLSQTNETISSEYYKLLIAIKTFILSADRQAQIHPLLLSKVQAKLIQGLASTFEQSRKLVFGQFAEWATKKVSPQQNIESLVEILKKMYNSKFEGQWLIGVVPTMLTLIRLSSDYKRPFSKTILEENMQYYDWDFRNFKINDASLPYTPFTAFAGKRKDGMQSLGGTQGRNLNGVIRATQNNLSQEQQIFTMLGSLSLSSQSVGSQPSLPIEIDEETSVVSDKYSKINDLFRTKRRRNEIMDSFKESNLNKGSPLVQFVQDKIRFSKSYTVQRGGVRLKKGIAREKVKKGAILRAYKIGELPNIEISVQDLIQPLVFLTAHDNQLAGELILQLTDEMCSVSLKNCNIMKDTLCQFLLGNTVSNFNFVSTLQKCLIRICQKSGKFMDISLKDVSIRSNTVGYAVLFTEENLIQLLLQNEKTDVESLKAKRDKMNNQWHDLADYYQALNEFSLIEAVMLRITEGELRDNLTRALRAKRDGDIIEARKLIADIMGTSNEIRLKHFLDRQKIDCSILLSQWDDICIQSEKKRQKRQHQSSEQLRMLSIALENIDDSPNRRKQLEILNIIGEKYQYERGIISVMRETELNKARFHALNTRQIFRREWQRLSSFAFSSKHQLLQSLQKCYQLIQFLQLYGKTEAKQSQCLKLFETWGNRKADQIFDDNVTWIQILSSRSMFGGLLGKRWGLKEQQMAKSRTSWLVQVVNGMVNKGVLGYAENIIRRALSLHRMTKQFSWGVYQSISQLKLMQIMKKESIRLQDYEIVPKLIQKQMDTHRHTSNGYRFKLLAIKNQYLEGYLDICLNRKAQVNFGTFAMQVINVLKNYEEIKKGLKQCMKNKELDEVFSKNIHFKYAVFLENLLSIVKGKFEIREIKDPLENYGLNAEKIALKFIQELLHSMKMLDLHQNFTLSYEEDQQLFSMLLKLIRIVQTEYRTVGKQFSEAISDRHIPKWIFIYFIPQIIKNINNFDIAMYFREIFDYLLVHYPQALIYPFNCAYPRLKDCHTELTKYLYDELHSKMGKYFELIQNLFLLQHPQMRLKDIFTKYAQHGESQMALVELNQFIAKNPLRGRYNQRFHENNVKKINEFLELRKKGSNTQISQFIKNIIASLDPHRSNTMKHFTRLSDGSHWFQEYNTSDWARIEVPGTSYCKFEEPLSWNRVYIESFDNSLLTLTSIRRPKRISLLGSNQKIFMLLVKGGEDVRLDQRVQHLFDLVNRILRHNTETNKQQLQISRFQVIPMKTMFGVFQWVDNSKTLKLFYQTEFKQIKKNNQVNLSTGNQGFLEFHAYFKRLCPGVDDRHVWHRTLITRSEDQVVRNFGRCQGRIPYGLLRFGLQKLAKNYDSFLHLKNKFICNYAAICFITYLFGIADRHLENFLIQTSKGNLVMIDFGYSFGAGVELPIPQVIPFRLTKSIKELAAPIGIDGLFKKCMLACYEALHKKMQLIVDYCDVFVDDPLMQWVWVSRKQLNQGSANNPQYISSAQQSFSVSQQAPQRKLFSNKIKIVQNKLKGYNPRLILELLLVESRHKTANYLQPLKKAIWGKAKSRAEILTGQQLINELIGLATDRNVIGRSYIGLNLFV